MEGIYKIDPHKIDQYSLNNYLGKAGVSGLIILIFLVIIVFNKDKDDWSELTALFIIVGFMGILLVIGYLFIKPPGLDTVIEIRSDRILNKRNGFTVEMDYEDLGRFIEDKTGLLILRKGLKGELDYFTSKRLKTTNRNVVFIPCAIERFSEVCNFLKLKKKMINL